MKQLRILMISLLLILTVSAIVITATVDAEKHDIRFTETIISGDPAYADGLSVSVRARYGSALHWDITHTIDIAEPKTESHFSLFATGDEYEIHKRFYLCVARELLIATAYPNGDRLPSAWSSGVMYPLRNEFEALWDTAKQHGSAHETILLSDYYEYYPVENFLSISGMDRTQYDAINEFFRIPVLTREQRRLSVTVEDGTTRFSIQPYGIYFDFTTQSAFTDDACYFVFDNKAIGTSARVDTTMIPGGYGIYRIPLHTNGAPETVYPLAEETNILTLEISEDGELLYLITEENGEGHLTVIDVATMTAVYEYKATEKLYDKILKGENFILLHLNDAYELITIENGVYRKAFSFQYCYSHSLNDASLSYRDGKLTIADPLRIHSAEPVGVGFSVAVYGDTGLLFHGEYDCNLDHPYVDLTREQSGWLTYRLDPITIGQHRRSDQVS
ncbi:MAG: hypothetical protein IJV98_06215 [Clostridia bacterium]|nr:hypothetical protein [Clostridia bacterium]